MAFFAEDSKAAFSNRLALFHTLSTDAGVGLGHNIFYIGRYTENLKNILGKCLVQKAVTCVKALVVQIKV